MAKKKDIEPLDTEISILQMYNSINKVDKKLKDMEKRSIIRTIIGVGPFAILMIIFFISKNPVFLLIGCGYLTISVTATMIYDTVKELKKDNTSNKTNDNNIINLKKAKEPELEDLLKEMNERKKPEEFYTPDFKAFLDSRPEDESIINEQSTVPDLKLIEKEAIFTKEEAVAYLVDNVNDYYTIYQLPRFAISPNEWDKFFDIMYNLYCEKEMVNNFYDDMFDLIKLFFANALIDNRRNLNLTGLSKTLDYYVGSNFTKREVLKLQKEILTIMDKSAVINFEANVSRNRKK